MPLNPEEVVNKRFSPTKFRQGYDEEEVDEFLDEVVAELRRLNAENDELRAKLTACEGRVSELSRAASGRSDQATSSTTSGTAAPAPAAAAAAATTPAPASATAPAPAGASGSAHPGATQPVPAQAPAPAATANEPESAAGMLALAQRLHDEHVQAGKDERKKIVAEAQAHASRLVREAEDKQRQTLGDLDQQRQVLERKVDELRSFEREYRARLKAYLETQLRELEAKAPVSGRPDRAAESGTAGASADGGSATSSTGQDTPRFPFGG